MLPYFGCTVHAPQDHPIYYIIICIQVALTTLALSAIGYLTYVVGWGVCFRYIYIVISYISLIKKPCFYACMAYTLTSQNNPHGSARRSQLWIRRFLFCLLVLHCGRSCGVRLLPTARDLIASALRPLRSYGYRILVFNKLLLYPLTMHCVI